MATSLPLARSGGGRDNGGTYPKGTMRDLIQQLPTVLVLGALVAIFVALQRRDRSLRMRYWLVGWGLMFLHFFVSLLDISSSYGRFENFVEMASLLLTGLAFLISVSGSVTERGWLRWLGAWFALPLIVYAGLLARGVRSPWPYALCLLLYVFSGALFGILRQHTRSWITALPLAAMVFGGWAVYRVMGGDAELGFRALLLVTFSTTAILFARSYPRLTPGGLTTTAGFASWAGIWGLEIFIPAVIQWVGADSALWSVPTLFLAFGMIVTLLEDESRAAQNAREQERAAAIQLERFADVTSRLLSGVEVPAFCSHIAQVITEATTFLRVAILLTDEGDRMVLAGHAGIGGSVLEELEASMTRISAGAAAELCRRGRLLGKSAVLLTAEEMAEFNPVRTTRHYDHNPYWQAGDELMVPLISPRGAFLGLISLDDPRDPARVTSEEMSKIEMLAADLAVAIDNAALQRQLLVSEKLAGLGQLVSGVAHEMNNPLTAVLGYSELLSDRTQDPELRRGLATINREAQRIKGIVGNLLRFAQQDRSERRPVDVLALLQDIARTKTYEARNRGIELVANLSSLPPVSGDENQLRQVFVNVLNNAFEAVENAAEKRVTLIGRAEDSQVVLTVLDTGPGFKDVDRVFDPFFTTKSPGKGVGLGLSICYGVLKQHGGNIIARNVHPAGACISIQLPVAKVQAATN